MSADNESTFPKGAELIVYWPNDDQWYHGVVMTTKPGRVHLEYEDGSHEWVNLKTTEWKLWSKDARRFVRDFQNQKVRRMKRLKVGSRVSVFWPFEKVFFTGTVIKAAGSKHLIKYNDGHEVWTHLFHQEFYEVSQQDSSQPSIVLKKRKRTFLQDMPESQIGQGWKSKIQGKPVVEPSMDQVSTKATLTSKRSGSPISSLVPEQHALTPTRSVQCTPNFMIREAWEDESLMMRAGSLQHRGTSHRGFLRNFLDSSSAHSCRIV